MAGEYPLLLGLLRHRTHKELAVRIVQAVLSAGTRISSVDKVNMLFRCVPVTTAQSLPICPFMAQQSHTIVVVNQ